MPWGATRFNGSKKRFTIYDLGTSGMVWRIERSGAKVEIDRQKTKNVANHRKPDRERESLVRNRF